MNKNHDQIRPEVLELFVRSRQKASLYHKLVIHCCLFLKHKHLAWTGSPPPIQVLSLVIVFINNHTCCAKRNKLLILYTFSIQFAPRSCLGCSERCKSAIFSKKSSAHGEKGSDTRPLQWPHTSSSLWQNSPPDLRGANITMSSVLIDLCTADLEILPNLPNYF